MWESGEAVDVLADGVVIFDRNETVVLVNRAAEQLFGVDRSKVVGAQFVDVFSLTSNDGRTWLEYNAPFQGPSTRTGVPEQSWLLPDGNECLVTARIRRDEPLGPPTGVAVSVRSGRGRARLDRERSDLVAAVAHELRSPLTGVKGFVAAMLSRWTRLNDEQKLLMLTTVHADADRLSRLIAELLDVARLDTGRLSLARRGADVRVLLERIITNVQAGAPHVIELDARSDLPEVYIDPDKFTQVVTNVVENAIRHGGGTVNVRAEPSVQRGLDHRRCPAHHRRRGRGHPDRDAPPRVHEVLDRPRRPGRHRSRPAASSTASCAPTAAPSHLDAPRGGARIVMDWPGQPDF